MSDTISCPSCEATIPGSATFCPSCGMKVDGASGQVHEPVQQEPVQEETPQHESVQHESVQHESVQHESVQHESVQQKPAAPRSDDRPFVDDVTRIIPLPGDATGTNAPGLHDATQVIPLTQPPSMYPAPAADRPPEPSWASSPPLAPPPPGWAPAPAPPQQVWGQQGPAPAPWEQPGAGPPQWGQQGQPQPSWAAPPPPGTMAGSGRAVLPAVLALVGAVLIIAGVFSPWLESKGNVSAISGWDFVTKATADLQSFKRTPDPAFLLGIAAASIVVVLVLFAGKLRALMRVVLMAAGLGAGAILVVDYLGIKDAVTKNFGTDVRVDYQYGFWLCAIGAVVLLLASVMPSRKAPRRKG